MYELYGIGSPSVCKVPILLEELGLAYRHVPIDVVGGEQFDPAFVRLSPNNKVPLLIDHAPADGGAPLPIWESGAIMLYLAEKEGRFLPGGPRARAEAMAWLFWQASGLSPMSGQSAHFAQYELPGSDYAKQRYWKECNRLYAVLDRQLRGKEHVLGAYSIVDMACYSWIRLAPFIKQDVSAFPDLARWTTAMEARPAVVRAYAAIDAWPRSTASQEERFAGMCGHDASVVR